MDDMNPSLELAITTATLEYEAKLKLIAENFDINYESLLKTPGVGIKVAHNITRTRADTAFNAFQKQHAQQIRADICKC